MATTFTSREFNQDTGRAKKAAEKEPVFITDRGRPSHVLMSIEQYEALSSQRKTLGEMLAMENADSIEFEIPRIDELPRPAEFE